MRVKKVNAFTDSIHGGNPAGVVLESTDLSTNQMKSITTLLQVSETAFVSSSKLADYKVRFFSPTTEVDLCGHATIATFFSMAHDGIIPPSKKPVIVKQETNAGILPVDIHLTEDKRPKVMMTQSTPILKKISFKTKSIAQSLCIEETAINQTLPRCIVSTGLYTLPICINSLDILKEINPDFGLVKTLCTQLGVGSMHVYTFDTFDENSLYHARNFAPLYGINEDPVTGTANGAVCSYLYQSKKITENNVICEQGDIIGRPGRVFVEIDQKSIKVGGTATLVKEQEIRGDEIQ